jgi:mRNA interferase RelE/StbE
LITYRFETPQAVADTIGHLPPEVRRAITAAFRALSQNPRLGEPLRRELEGYWKYRVRRFRIVYSIDRGRRVIRVLAVGHRRGIYERAAELARGRP